ncbi:hypothetical protein GOP47_0007731 [Adiantum capillus-veneris]|uniref:Uncharacterized protein n=1 Tax=Adiantum capillus-veneris TaxID=13818 RepID=A0A9D4V2S1_ADICA|nr:hypothetical protein GOP47_0007731 [Adiantum capillus-veneris]
MKSMREPYHCKLEEFWHRQIGHISPKAYAHRVGGCQDLIERLHLYGKLDGHVGCVNTVHFNPSGEILVSGSDDRKIVFWDWAAKTSRLSYCSGHDSNVFQAKVMPFSDDRSVVSCAADGQVRHAQFKEDGMVETKKLAKHQGRAHKLAIEPGSPRLFYSCGEDGVVRHFDLRSNKSTKLFSCLSSAAGSNQWRRRAVVRLNAIVINPRNPLYFAVGGSDEFVRVYDIRKTLCGTGDHPVDTFTPSHLIGSDQVHITCVAYSSQEELLASYNDEQIYLFKKDMGYGSDPKSASCEGANASTKEPQVYEGHRNAQTVKGVNFFGPNTEYVVSGSDCGRIFIWKKAGGQLVSLMLGDDQVVNCLEPHPYATVLATSGLDHDVKIWAPTAEDRLPLPPDAEKVMEMNKNNREERTPFAIIPDVMMHLLRVQRLHARRHGRSSEDGMRAHDDDSGGIRVEDGESDSSSDDGSQECIIS